MTLPDLAWLNTIPVIGAKLMQAGTTCWIWGGQRSWRKSALYWHHHHLVRWASGAYRALLVHCALMLLFSALLYWRGEQWHKAFAILRPVWQAFAEMPPTAGGTGYPRGGAGCGGDGVIQAVLGGIGLAVSGVPYATL